MRSAAEWLLLPLFLFPLLAGLGLGIWAQETHRADLARVRDGGAAIARRWLEGPDGPAAWMPAQAAAAFAPGRALRGEAGDWVPFILPSGRGEVRLPGLPRETWVFADAFPAGLLPAALADAGVRLDVEVGRPPIGADGVDEATRVFAALLERPDLEVLRLAPLPVATKRFVVGRWQRAGTDLAGLDVAARLLDVLADFERAAGEAGVRLPPGAHRMGERLAMSTGGVEPLLLYPDPDDVLPRSVLAEGGREEDPCRLVWTFPPGAHVPERVVWSGTLAAPLAGHWRWVAKFDGWWQASRVRRWAAPVAALLVLSLAIPAALLVSLRRRRRHEEARVRFLNELAHDLRTPLTSLRLHAELLARGTEDPARRARYEATLTREAARLSGLLANVLDLSRLERGQRALETARVDVARAVRQTAQEFAAAHPRRKDDVTLKGAEGVQVAADASALARILANLLDNAGKFTPPGTPIAVRWRREEDGVRIVVSDEGPGIAPADARRVFGRYVRGRGSDAVPGTGLGLALVRELVREMGGEVALLPSSRGAAFEVRLPEAKRD